MENGEGAVGDWRKKLNTYNINDISSNYACEVMLMAELSTDFSEAIELFHHGAQSNLTNVKSLNWDDFMVTTNAIKNSENDEYTSILKSATDEAAKYFGKQIPCELSTKLIKLAIIKIIKDYATNQRPSCSQKKLPRMSQIVKGKKGVKMETPQKESITVFGKEMLYILINGYYDPHVIIELSKCGIMLSAIIELAYSDTLFHEIDWEQDTAKFPREEMFRFLNFGHCLGINSNKNPCSELVHINSNVNTKIKSICYFWKLVYQQLQGERLAECLSNTVHLRISPLYVISPKKGTHSYERQSLEIYSYISSEILKVVEAKRLHSDYLQNMKISKIDSPPASVAIDTLKSYKRVVDSIPPEGATVELLLSGLLEEICTKVPDPTRSLSKKFRRESVGSKIAEKLKINTVPSASEPLPSTSRNESCRSTDISHEKQMMSHVSVPRQNQASATNSKSKKIRTFHESSLLELGTLCFSHLPPHVHQTCIKSLIYCPVVRSLQQREPLSAVQVVMKNNILQTLSQHVQLSEEQVRNTMNLELFKMLTCLAKEKSADTKCDTVFCGYIETEEKIRNTFEAYISTIELAHIKDKREEEMYVNIPYTNMDDVPSIYESRNILSYMWYEKLEPIVALQQLGQAYRDYACVDQKFCSFTDSMMIRFHNDIDEFGISEKTYNQSIRTGVGLRDFCKYVMREEVLEIKSPKYQPKSKKHIQPNKGRFQNNPHSFLGYDYGTSRLQLLGGTTTFHSLDGYKITVDTTTILGQPKKVSLNVTIKGHNFIVHYINKDPIPEKPLMFHFSLADNTIIAFNKPPKVKKGQLIVGEQVNKSKRHKSNPHSNIIHLRQKRRQPSYGAQSTTFKLRQKLLPTLEDLLKKIKEAKQQQIPLFRILSSKLHKFVYIKRIKSHIEIQLGNNTISLLCKHPHYKVKKVVTKLLRSEINNDKYTTKHYYDVKLSLPSGLLIDTLRRIGKKPFNIKQQYLARVPQSQSISGECSRSFMRTGHLVIKGCDGDMRILSTNGQIVECKLSHKIQKTSIKYSINRKESTFKGQQNVSLKRKTQPLCCHLQKHIIGGKFRRQRNNKSKWALYGRTKHFKAISNDKIFQIRDCDGHEEYYYKRQNGARCLLTANGVLTCEFDDKTRITTWFTIEQEMIRIVDPQGYSWASNSRRRRTTSFTVGKLLQAIDMQQDDWVSVNIVYKFEHPKYATIIYSRLDHMVKIMLPNDVIISGTKEGFYSISVDGLISAKITNDNIHLESNLCHSCDHSSVTTINVKPMYKNIHPVPEDTLLLQTYDTYNKMFIVDYGGSYYRNSDYIKKRSNRIDCKVHDQQDYQKLYVLNRDLSATKFWDIKAYRKRVAEATSNNDSVVHFNPEIGNSSEKYRSLEIQHYKFKQNNMRFTTFYEYDRLLPSALRKDFIIPQVAYCFKLEIHALSAGTRSQLLQNVVHKLATFQIEFDKTSEDVVHHFLRIVSKEFMSIKAHIDLEFAAIDRNVSVPLNPVPKYLEDFRPAAARKVLTPISLSTEVKSCGTTYYLPLKQIMIWQPNTSDEVVNLTNQPTPQHDRDHKMAKKSRWDWLGLKKPKNRYIKPGEEKSKVSAVNTFKLKVGRLINLKILSRKPQQQAETVNKYLDCCVKKTKNLLIQQEEMSLRRKATTTKQQRPIKSKLPSDDQSLTIRVIYDPQQRPKKSEFEETAAQPSTSYQHKFTAQESVSEQTSSESITYVRQNNSGEQSMDSSSDADDIIALVMLPSRRGWQNSIQ